MRFFPDFPTILQSDQVDASWGKSETVCRLQLTDDKKSCSVLWSQTLFVWYFQPILEHMFSFVMRLLATRRTFLHGFVVIGTTFKSGSVIFSRAVYDAQFSFVTIYKVGKCMMPSVLKICSEFKSHVVYSSLKKNITLWKWMVCYCGFMLI